MEAIRGIFQNGEVKLIEPPPVQESEDVIVIFPAKSKRIVKIGGTYKGYPINYPEVEKELKNLNLETKSHLLEEANY